MEYRMLTFRRYISLITIIEDGGITAIEYVRIQSEEYLWSGQPCPCPYSCSFPCPLSEVPEHDPPVLLDLYVAGLLEQGRLLGVGVEVHLEGTVSRSHV